MREHWEEQLRKLHAGAWALVLNHIEGLVIKQKTFAFVRHFK